MNKRGLRAYTAQTRGMWSAEKSIFGFSDSVDELRLEELSL
ncbi:hypothetical protein [Paenibacillus germinis]|nr:hypothetical protein [Paenibacillus germinis]